MRIATILLILVAGDATAADQIFKCKTPEGTTVFSSKPCGNDAQEVRIRPGPKAPEEEETPQLEVAETADKNPPVAEPKLSDEEMDRQARIQADRVVEDCRALAAALARQVREINDKDYANELAFATREELARAKLRDMQPVAARMDAVHAECEDRWYAAYTAAKFR